jgi:hypothetical protein
MLSEHATQVELRDRDGTTSRVIRTLGLLVVVLCLIVRPQQPGAAAPLAQDVILVITSPSEGMTVSGQVAVQGTATRPNFVSYGVLYAPGSTVTGATSWQQNNPIAWDVRSMVVNGVLGVWDTTQLPNGPYVLALVMFEVGNETPMVFFVNNLTVNNQEPTPTPTPEATPTPEPEEPGSPLDPTQEPGDPPPAATIVQPPTATPRPTPTLGPDDIGGAVDPDDGDDGIGGLFAPGLFSMEAIKEAASLGAQLAFLIYAIGALYVLAKAVIRYYLRQTRRKPGS